MYIAKKIFTLDLIHISKWQDMSSTVNNIIRFCITDRGFFEDGRPKKKKNKMSSNMRSVPDLKKTE